MSGTSGSSFSSSPREPEPPDEPAVRFDTLGCFGTATGSDGEPITEFLRGPRPAAAPPVPLVDDAAPRGLGVMCTDTSDADCRGWRRDACWPGECECCCE